MRPLLPAFCFLVMATFGLSAEPAPAVSHLTCEGLVEPTLLDTTTPRFSWRLESAERGARQTAFQLRVTALAADGKSAGDPVETARLASDQSQWATFPQFVAKPKTRYTWQVRVWDERERDSGWSAPATFETGLLGGNWPAAWIGDGVTVARDTAPRARYFRQEFSTGAAPVKARLYLSAFGLVEPWLNGRKITEDKFLPGWPDYRKRVFYVAYDVTSHVLAGKNALGLVLGDGWYSSTLMRNSQYGAQPLVSAFLELTDASGRTTVVSTGKNAQWSEGPITAQAIYYGETFDARRGEPNWCAPELPSSKWTWQAAQLQGVSAIALTARFSPPVRETEQLRPISRREVRPGVFLYDLGQNMVGWARLKISATPGKEIMLRFAEMLEPDGNIHTANLRRAHATATYIARGEGVETWEPRFTFFGFRYVELSGVAQPMDDAITGIVLHSDLPRIGFFECSNPLLNKLYANTLWGQKGNFLEVPTDCPQRDERLGWTGDAQVFAHTANYNFASGAFYRQWLAALRDSYRDEPGGPVGFADIAPDIGLRYGSAGWGDAAVIIPYVTWLHTGDRRILEENFDAIQRWVEAQARDFPDGIRRSSRSYGDWLAPGFKAAEAPTPYVLIATAYYAHVTDIAGRIAKELGRTATAERDRALFAQIREAFAGEFIADDARITSDEQTAYLLALGFDLVPENFRAKMVAHLVRKFAEKNDHLATGFLGTPLVTPVLGANGHADLAYKVLLQESYPGWLFSVKNGATTIWERWDSWTPEKGFHPEGMNSFNHYAYGSVVGWLYDSVAGLKPSASGAGWKRFEIAPTPGGGLTSAKAKLETPYGIAASAWQIASGRFELDVIVPPNTQARVSLPAGAVSDITEGTSPLSDHRELTAVQSQNGRVTFTAPAGTYHFAMPTAAR
jgi:alpha-L-rhamnosidase